MLFVPQEAETTRRRSLLVDYINEPGLRVNTASSRQATKSSRIHFRGSLCCEITSLQHDLGSIMISRIEWQSGYLVCSCDCPSSTRVDTFWNFSLAILEKEDLLSNHWDRSLFEVRPLQPMRGAAKGALLALNNMMTLSRLNLLTNQVWDCATVRHYRQPCVFLHSRPVWEASPLEDVCNPVVYNLRTHCRHCCTSGRQLGPSAGVFFIFLFYLVFCVGSIPFLHANEIAPAMQRAQICCPSTASTRLFNLIVAEVTAVAVTNIGWKYWIVFCVLITVFVPVIYFLFPEINGVCLTISVVEMS